MCTHEREREEYMTASAFVFACLVNFVFSRARSVTLPSQSYAY